MYDIWSMSIKKRNPLLVLLFTVITFGIYGIYWFVQTKREINSLGAKIPTAWLMIIPVVNIYWLYKYTEGFTQYVKKGNTLLWFIVLFLVGFLAFPIFQIELNKKARR